MAAEFMTVLFRVYGAYIVAFGLLAIAVAATAFRRGRLGLVGVTDLQHDRIRRGHDVRLDRRRDRTVRDDGIPRSRRNLWGARRQSAFRCGGAVRATGGLSVRGLCRD